MFRLLAVVLVASFAAQTIAHAQTKPVVTTLGPDFAKTGSSSATASFILQ